ncbi:MAG: alpha-L-fucosidase [Lentisphaerae bacterium]|nr:alpha-L-fucosidase [Lentisphaerota bacterium]
MTDPTAWLADRGWGVLCHWLGIQPNPDGSGGMTAEAWNAQVDAFDAEGLARQLESAGAPYFFITIGQNSGHYIAPNATYDRFVGIHPSKCSRRDIVADLYEVLHPRGIELLVYLPSGAPAADPIAVERLEWEWGFATPAWGVHRTGKRLAAFQRKWEAIIRDWSTRWGPKVRGWWLDGCYFADEMYRHDDEPNFRSFAAALKAGNPEAVVAFNPGVLTPVVCHTEHEDFTAGEISTALPECPGPWVERNGHKARYHVLSYLGEDWCKGRPRFPDELVVGFTKHVAEKGGVTTWDVPIGRNGLIPEPFVRQLKALGASGLGNRHRA